MVSIKKGEVVSRNKKIAYFAGCTANYIDTEVGISTIQVLEKNGFNPIFPEQKCCGTPMLACDRRDTFFSHAQFNIQSLTDSDCDIVTACTSCALTIKHEYPKHLQSREAASLSKRTYDIIEYLCLLKDRGELNTDFQPRDLKVAYHTPCHLKVLGEELVTRRLALLKSIPGISISRIEKGCCGMGGSFGVKQSNFDLSMKIGEALFEGLKESAADLTATDCPTCKMQIQQGTGSVVKNPILIVRQAYGLE
jgi:glycerol-3-phosphate dehydrogenase subunit C